MIKFDSKPTTLMHFIRLSSYFTTVIKPGISTISFASAA